MSLKTIRQQTGREGPSSWPYYDLLEELFH